MGEFNAENTEVVLAKKSVRTDLWAQDKKSFIGFAPRDRKTGNETHLSVSGGGIRIYGLRTYEARDQIGVFKSKTDKVFEADSLTLTYESALAVCKEALMKLRSKFD